MKLLLCKSVEHLGIVGDVVEVKTGYARNFLLPYGLATEPTTGNMKRLAEARRIAERERAAERERWAALCEKLEGVEVTIRAKANEDGHLYGSVGKKEIAAALEAEGHIVKPEQVHLDAPIRHLDNVQVEVRLDAELKAQIKVWVVREKVEGESDEEQDAPSESAAVSMEAGMNGDGAD